MANILGGCLCIILAGCGSSVDIMESQSDTAIFEQGRQYYDQGEFKEALQHFLYVKDHFLRSEYAGLTRFYAGESYFALEKYEDAAIEYKSFLSFFPNDPYAPAAQFKLGMSYFQQSLGPERDQTMLDKALTTLEEVQQKYPDKREYVEKAGEQINKVKQKLALHEYLVAEFYRKEDLYKSSNQRLAYLLEHYPEAPVISDALYLLGRNYQELDEPEKARDRFLQLAQAYPNHEHASEIREYLAESGITDIPHTASQSVVPRRAESPSMQSPLPSSETSSVPRVSSKGFIVLIRDEKVFTDLIRTDGIREGMILEVARENQLIGKIRIVEIHEGFSIGEIESVESGMMIQEEDRVLLPE